jgi:hypothetical protein
VLVVLFGGLLAGCGASLVETGDIGDPRWFQIAPEANIPDTEENRAILSAINAYREAMSTLDTKAAQSFVATGYFENASSTDDPGDDYGNEMVPIVLEDYVDTAVQEIRYGIKVYELHREGGVVHVDYEYRWHFYYTLAGRNYWRSQHDVNRISLVQEEGQWRAVGGL